MGVTGWYRRFIAEYAIISAPISELLKKGKKFIWNDDAQHAFHALKYSLVTAPVLQYPNFGKTFYIQCDASSTGIGNVLFQTDDHNQKFPISFMSKKLNKAQRNYSVTELERYADKLIVKKFRAYIEGFHFVIITDHMPA